MYKVIKFFTDLQDKGYAYNVGDTYPRDGLTVSKKRIAELSSNKNKQKTPLIEEVVEEVVEEETTSKKSKKNTEE